MVAMGVLKWVDWTVSEPRYFQLQTDHTPVHLALLDEVRVSGHCAGEQEQFWFLCNTECLSFAVRQ